MLTSLVPVSSTFLGVPSDLSAAEQRATMEFKKDGQKLLKDYHERTLQLSIMFRETE